MTDTTPVKAESAQPAAAKKSFPPRFGSRGNFSARRRSSEVQVESEYDEKNIEIVRVTRVTKGGKRMRFRALTILGNRKGRVGFGLAKGLDVAGATSKAATKARKSLITVPIVNDTVPYFVEAKFGASRIIIKPASRGTGLKAGGAVRVVLELAGVPNVSAKMLGSSNKTNNVKATFKALSLYKATLTSVTPGAVKDEANPHSPKAITQP